MRSSYIGSQDPLTGALNSYMYYDTQETQCFAFKMSHFVIPLQIAQGV
jgi:hypothetical protein